MRLHRFYISNPLSLNDTSVTISDEKLVHQWKNVFRLGKGDSVIVFNGSGKEYEAVIEDISGSAAALEISSEQDCPAIPLPTIHVAASLIKKERFEWMVEKLTELGVTSIFPIVSERSQLKQLGIDRLVSIAKEAAEQSGRGSLPQISSPSALKDVIGHVKGTLIIFHGDSEEMLTAAAVSDLNAKELTIFIGPEGGWGEGDLELFRRHDMKIYSLGDLTLRAETAALAAVSLMRFTK